MTRTSSLGQFTNLPALGDGSDITAVGTTMADRIEKYVGMRFATAVARDALITVPEAGMRAYLTTPKVWTEYDGTAWRGEWVTYTTQIDQGATTNIAKTSVDSTYRYDGSCIEWFFGINITGAGTAGSGVTLTLPVASVVPTVAAFGHMGSGMIFDQSIATRYHGSWEMTLATTVIGLSANGVSSNIWGSTPAVALAAGDVIRGSLRYRWV